MFDIDVHGTYDRFGQLIGVGRSAVADMVKREILPASGTLHQWNQAYCAHLREIAAGRFAAGDLDLGAERAGLARAQRERIEMQNAVTRGDLAPVSLIEEVLAMAGARAAKILDTIPGTIRRREPSLSADTLAAIARDIAKVRNIAASISLAQLREEEGGEREDDGEGASGEAD